MVLIITGKLNELSADTREGSNTPHPPPHQKKKNKKVKN